MRVIASRSVGAPVPLTDHYEAVVCDLCGSPGGRVLARIPSGAAVADPLQRFCLDALEFPGEGISLVRCPICRSGYQNPRLSEEGMRVFYTRFYDPDGPGEAYHRAPQPDLDAARYGAIAATGRTSGVVLDVGAGKGYGLEAFPFVIRADERHVHRRTRSPMRARCRTALSRRARSTFSP